MAKGSYSKTRFLEFLNYLKSENIHTGSTLADWRSAAASLLDNLSSNEEKDLRRINIDSLVERFAQRSCEQHQSITPWVLHQHRIQLSLAVGDFVAYVINPIRYRAERARNATRFAEPSLANPRRAGHSAANFAAG